MVRSRTPAQLLIFAVRISIFLALSQAAVVAAPPYVYPEPQAVREPSPEAISAPLPGPRQLLGDPVLNENPQAPAIPPAAPAATDQPLPINLATALCLSNARPLVIAFAQNSVEAAAARLDRANVLWLPNLKFRLPILPPRRRRPGHQRRQNHTCKCFIIIFFRQIKMIFLIQVINLNPPRKGILVFPITFSVKTFISCRLQYFLRSLQVYLLWSPFLMSRQTHLPQGQYFFFINKQL